ncbi:hypothetical protein L6E12_26740, partial [Actinokineospora sp. PR83]|nr:hypothetical protein [Actinokineospora sp. PR83]
MGIELPAELVSVAAAAGVVWPEADEDKMRQAAGAWREAGVRMGSLAGDADGTARTALSSFAGEAGDAANRHWAGFVTPDTGHLTATITHCTANADKLEHAAQQVGEAKVAIVRNLVELAKNTDAAHSAAAAGLPNALLGLETALRGTAANVAHIKDTLVGSVLPGTGAAGFTNVVDPNPGASGGPIGSGLLAPVQNLVGGGSAGQAGQGLAGVVPGVVSGLTGNAPTGLPVVDTMVRGVQHAVANQALPVLGGGGPGAPAGAGATGLPLVDNLVSGVDQALTGNPAGGPVSGVLHGVGQVVDTTAGVVDTASGTVNHVVGAQPGTGPLDPVAQVVDNAAGAVDRGTEHAGSQAGHQAQPGWGPSGPVPSGSGPSAPVVSGVVDLPGHVAAELPVNHDAVRASSAAVLDVLAQAAAPAAGAVPPAQQSLGGAFAGGAVGTGGGVGGGGVVGGAGGGAGAVGGGGPVSSAPVSGGPGASAAVVGRLAAPVAGAVPGAGAVAGGPGAPGGPGGSGGPGGGSGAAGGAATGRAEPGGARTEPGARAAAGAVAAAGGASGSGGGRLAGADPGVAATDHGKPGTAK